MPKTENVCPICGGEEYYATQPEYRELGCLPCGWSVRATTDDGKDWVIRTNAASYIENGEHNA